MGELGWDDPKYDTSGTENMSDDEDHPAGNTQTGWSVLAFALTAVVHPAG
jgi:hypothetical protein